MSRTDIMVRPVTVIHFLAPIGRSLSFQVFAETLSLRQFRSFHSCIISQCRSKVHIQDNVFVACTCGDFFRVADHEGHVQRFFVHHSFVEHTMFAQEVALVGDVNDNGIFAQSFFIQHLQQAADVIVDRRPATQVVLDHLLIDLLAGSHLIHTFRRERKFRVTAPPGIRIFGSCLPTPSHVLQLLTFKCPARLFGAELHHTFGFRENNVVVKMFHPFGEVPGFVRRFEMTAHHKRFILITVAYPFHRLVGYDIGRETFDLGSLLSLIVIHPVFSSLEDRVHVFPLVVEDIEVVETGRLSFQMPFTDQGRLVTARLHLLGDIIDRRLQSVLQRVDTVTMAIRPGHDSGTARCGDRVGTETVIQHTAFVGQTADILILNIIGQDTSVDTPCLGSVVVRQNKENVRAFSCLFLCFLVRATTNNRQACSQHACFQN